MKKNIQKYSSLLGLFVCLLSPFGLLAQNGWRWANSWNGNDGSGSIRHNIVIKSAFDDEGNIYVLGQFGGNARLHDQQGYYDICDSIWQMSLPNNPGMMLAKFDSLGNLLWRKAFKTPNPGVKPMDMAMRDGKIYLMGNAIHDEDGYIQYWDTTFFAYSTGMMPNPPYVIRNPPYERGSYTYFAIFDLDGNLLEDHFVGVLPRVFYSYMGYARQVRPFSSAKNLMCVDSQGNIYLAASVPYYGGEELPYYVVVDEDSATTYPVYFPGSAPEGYAIHNMVIFKFTPDWELAWAKPLIDHIGLPSGPLPIDSLKSAHLDLKGFSVDEDDNLYLSTKIYNVEIRGHSEEYPIFLYWDSTRYLDCGDPNKVQYISSICKYDSDGNLIWNNQPFVVVPADISSAYASGIFIQHFVKGEYVYVAGGVNRTRNDCMIYFDNPSNTLTFPEEMQYDAVGIFVRFDKNTGRFVNYGMIPSEIQSSTKGILSVINNHIIIGCLTNYLNVNTSTGLAFFNENGQLMKVDTFDTYGACETINVLAREDGTLLCDMVAFSDVRFSNGLSTEGCLMGKSNAVFALYHDDALSIPYPDGVQDHTKQPETLRLYPNPATDRVRIELPEDLTDYTVLLYDVQGHLAGTYHENIIDIRALNPGFYTVTVQTNTQMFTGKLVKE